MSQLHVACPRCRCAVPVPGVVIEGAFLRCPACQAEFPLGKPRGSHLALWIGAAVAVLGTATLVASLLVVLLRPAPHEQPVSAEPPRLAEATPLPATPPGAVADADNSLPNPPGSPSSAPAEIASSSLAPQAASPAPEAAPPSTAPLLRYRFDPGTTRRYAVTISVDMGSYTDELSGSLRFTVQPQKPGGVAGAGNGKPDAHRLDYQGTVVSRKKRKAGTMGGIPAGPSVLSDRGELVVDQQGKIVSDTGKLLLPYAHVSFGRLLFERFPDQAASSWEAEQEITIRRPKVETAPGAPYSRNRPIGPLTQFNAATLVESPARCKTEYNLGQSTNGKIVIRKHYQLKPLTESTDAPALEIEGWGNFTFHVADGLPEATQFNGMLTTDVAGVQVLAPLTIHCQRSTAPVAEIAAATPGLPNPADRMNPFAMDSEKLTELLTRVKQSSGLEQSVHLNTLMVMPPIEDRRQDVLQVLQPLLRDENSQVQFCASEAFARWCSPREIDLLVSNIDPSSGFLSSAFIRALGSMKTAQAAEALAQLVPNRNLRVDASGALRVMGPVAEEATLKLLTHPDAEVRDDACRTLGYIGGEKSITALTALLEQETSDSTRGAAQRALDKLQSPRP